MESIVTTSAPRAEGLSCLLHPIIPSPVINGYRNKSTFSVNRGPDGNPKTVGYYLGTWRDRSIVCVRSNHLKNIPEKHNQVAQGRWRAGERTSSIIAHVRHPRNLIGRKY
uniref:tRNA (uracil(54)-C(5))-methyltransferase homolog n=1 Tax=Halichoerus grypus TaxID=9711 RepID=UPI00165984C9|nr:tRNA (uracil(54)-C(5))-methyltransferase homolog [Halichoerus grypus]